MLVQYGDQNVIMKDSFEQKEFEVPEVEEI